jgi:hypothetical protein
MAVVGGTKTVDTVAMAEDTAVVAAVDATGVVDMVITEKTAVTSMRVELIAEDTVMRVTMVHLRTSFVEEAPFEMDASVKVEEEAVAGDEEVAEAGDLVEHLRSELQVPATR